MTQPKVALQMYTVRDEAANDFKGAYRRIAEMGYQGVQPAGYGNLPAEEFRTMIDELGVEVVGPHLNLTALENDLESEIEYCKKIGTTDLVIPAIPNERRASLEAWKENARSFNAIGERCRKAGMRLIYHNHDFEFKEFGGKLAIDLLLEETDPAHLLWEPDVYWIRHAGYDPAEYIRKYSGRCPLIHLKDMTRGEPHTFAEVGTGVIDFKPIFEASEAGGAEWYIVEQDRCEGSSFEAARTSLENMKRWGKL